MNTRITELLGIQYPIIQGAMANISDGRFTAAVSSTGALGVIFSGGRSAEEIRKDIHICRELTDKPFAVNATMQPKEIVKSVVDMLIEEKVEIVITSAGSPQVYLPTMKQAGMKVLSVVASPRQARKAEAAGADAIIAEGGESGGHIGDAHTLPLVAAVTAAVSVPVVAAGGIADGRGLAAAIMLGADAIQCGTAFLVTDECPISEVFKEKILAADVTDTLVTGRITNDVVRSLRSPLSEAMYDLELHGGDPVKIIEKGTGGLRRAVFDGNWETGSFQVGQTVGLLHDRTTCKKLVERIMCEAEETFCARMKYWHQG